LGEKTREEYSEITDETSGVGMLLFGNPNIRGEQMMRQPMLVVLCL
jgi:hypothetical protein